MPHQEPLLIDEGWRDRVGEAAVLAASSCHAEALRVGGSHFCEGWSAARFVIREFCLLTFLSVAAGIAPLNSRSPFRNLRLCCSGVRPMSFKQCWEEL